jgi:hypothetical protein
LDPRDTEAWVDAIVDYATEDGGRRAAQVRRMSGFQAPTWAAHFASVERFLETLPP